MPIFVMKFTLKHSHTYSFTYCPVAPSPSALQQQSWGVVTETVGSCKPKNVPSNPLQRNFADSDIPFKFWFLIVHCYYIEMKYTDTNWSCKVKTCWNSLISCNSFSLDSIGFFWSYFLGKKKKTVLFWCLAGSVDGAGNSWSWNSEFKTTLGVEII